MAHGQECSSAGESSRAGTVQQMLNDTHKHLIRLRDGNISMPKRVKQKLSDSALLELAYALSDGTVYEIVKELEDIQQLKERHLHQQRRKLLQGHLTERSDLCRKQTKEISVCTNVSEKKHLLQRQKEERVIMESKQANELRLRDEDIVKVLDSVADEQQSTLEQAQVPFFVTTTQAQHIKIQMYVLEMIQNVMKL